MRIFFYLFVFLFLPSEYVLAWGPLTHIALSTEILRTLAAISLPAAAEVILSRKSDFILGNVYADIIFGKNLVEYRDHSHNWRNGLKIMGNASTAGQKAFAYGYLCHLASDCVAHNFFVPRFLVLSHKKRYMMHTYWEMRFDNIHHNATWGQAVTLSGNLRNSLSSMLNGSLVTPLFPFSTHKMIFNGIMFLQRLKRWRMAVEKNSRKNGFTIPQSESDIYFNTSIKFILDFIKNPEGSTVFKYDPTGASAMEEAKNLRRSLKRKEIHSDRIYKIAQAYIPKWLATPYHNT